MIHDYKKNKADKDLLFEEQKSERVKAAHLDAQMQADSKYAACPSRQYQKDKEAGTLLQSEREKED